MNRYSKIALGLVAMATAFAANAQKAGDDVIGFGVAKITQRITVETMTSTVPSITSQVSGATAETSGATTLTASWLHMYTNNLATEFTLGLPPRIKMDITTPATNTTHADAAAADVYTPALVGKYLFSVFEGKLRPYVGAGVSYVSFKNVAVNTADTTIKTLAVTSAQLDDAWAPVYNLGAIYNFNDRWSLNASVAYIPIMTKLTTVGSAATGYARTSGAIRFDTTDYVVRLGYRF